MSTPSICPCDAANPNPITNLPGLPQIAFRAGDFNSFRRALLTPLLADPGQQPLEQALNAWQSGLGADPTIVDLGVMMVEWWAYLSDILTFYNERIANEDYLRTAALPETPAALIQLLGYRPRPAIAATGTLAALPAASLLPGQTVTLPAGLQFQSKPGPGGAPQTFELSAASTVGLPGQVPAMPPPTLIANLGDTLVYRPFELGLIDEGEKLMKKAVGKFGGSTPVAEGSYTSTPNYALLLQGTVTSLSNGTPLLLGPRDANIAPTLINLSSAPTVQTVAGGLKQTVLTFTTSTTPAAMAAASSRLQKSNQSAALWTVNGSAYSSTGGVIQLATLARQIRPGDYLVFTAPGRDAQLAQVHSAIDKMGDASSAGSPTSVSAGGTNKPTPIPVLHTQLTLTSASSPSLNTWLASAGAAAVSVLFGWVDAGTLIDQPPVPWNGVSTSLAAIQPAQFPAGNSIPILLADSLGIGEQALGTVASDGSLSLNWPKSTPVPLAPGLQPPIAVYYNLLPVTCGKTVANEILGSGDATQAGQSFKLSKSPVTYLATGSCYQSTVRITVNGLPWTEVASFYGQVAGAPVFVTREDSSQNTWIDFGDGVNGARLTTGSNNVVATYRIGGGAASPPAGKLTVIAQSYPGLQSVANPVAVSVCSVPVTAELLKQYAPRSVLTFGRAVSVFDYQALAAQAPGVTMAAASFSWDPVNLRAGVTVYVAGEANVATSVQTLLAAAGDPNRPVTVLPATDMPVSLTLSLITTPGMDQGAIRTAVQTVLCDPLAGLFSPAGIAIGQGLFDSVIESVCLAVLGVVAIQSMQFTVANLVTPGPLHSPGEGGYFSLDPGDLYLTTEVAANA